MKEKKKNILSTLFKPKANCSCGVTIVEEKKKDKKETES